jgi:hypothetical protein
VDVLCSVEVAAVRAEPHDDAERARDPADLQGKRRRFIRL